MINLFPLIRNSYLCVFRDQNFLFMQMDIKHTPDYIFEVSWEVCNKVGGIYTVLSTRANSLQKLYKDHIIFIGPDIWVEKESPWFTEDSDLFSEWKDYAYRNQQLQIRIGRWSVPGNPIVFLIKFEKFFEIKDNIYAQMWTDFGVDSLFGYSDYHEACMFAYARGVVIESFYRYYKLEAMNVIAHFNEWMTGMGALYIKKNIPKVATVFTTHATTVGRSIAGNNLPLYNHLKQYNGDQMARQLNVVAKHSVEKRTAQNVDCFTTVSDITAQECTQFLQRQPDVVTPNGFEKDFIPKGIAYKRSRKKARQILLNVTEKVLVHEVQRDALLIAISGRYEYRNKGIDVFIEAMNILRKTPQLAKDVIAFIMVPAWIKGPRADLVERLNDRVFSQSSSAMCPFVTHELVEPNHDLIMNQLRHLGFCNSENDRLKVIYVPSYLNGNDGVFNVSYYDLLVGMDLTVFPSYYEPWGYTPHESVAFSVPTITTTLSGFGSWAKKMGDKEGINDGIQVIYRDDYNNNEVSKEIADIVFDFSLKSPEQIAILQKSALAVADISDWSHFIVYYHEAYFNALHNSFVRLSKPYRLQNE